MKKKNHVRLSLRAIKIFKFYWFSLLFSLLEKILKKDQNIWCFGTWENYSHTLDNPRAIYEEIKSNKAITKVIFLKNQPFPDLQEHDDKTIFVKELSVKGSYYLAKAKVYLTGTSLTGFTNFHHLLTNKHFIVQLWHGIPLKKIGKLFAGESFWDDETHKYSATVCSSESDKYFMTRAFHPIDDKNVWKTGLPRNDFINGPQNTLPSDYKAELEALSKLKGEQKLILYAPTWRQNAEDVYNFNKDEMSTLNSFLTKYNSILAIRGHANVRSKTNYTDTIDFDRIIYVNDTPDVNIVLRVSDILITDYSSIYIDFLTTNKPIIYFTYDLQRYYEERGFLYSLEEAFCDDPVESFNTLIEKLDTVVRNGVSDVIRYERTKSLFHSHSSKPSREVVSNVIKAVSDQKNLGISKCEQS